MQVAVEEAGDGVKQAREVAIDLAVKYNAELWAVGVNELPYYGGSLACGLSGSRLPK